jgi:FemAB-related protein (PEP-CTERM system-associated)
VIHCIDFSRALDWDRFVNGRADSGPYHTVAWRLAVESAYGHQGYYLLAGQVGQIKGVLPLFLVKPPVLGFGGKIISLPFCDYGGLLSEDNETATELIEFSISLARDKGAGLELRSAVPIELLEKNIHFSQVTDKCRMLLELPNSSSALWNGFKSKLRSQVKKASKDGLVSRLGHNELLSDFYSVFARNMRDLGSPVHSRQWLKTIVDAFSERAAVAVVYYGKLPVAGGIVLTHGKLMTIPWASTLREYNKLSPNMLLYWTFLEHACEKGYEVFDFGRSTPNEGTYAFKKQWGAHPTPLYWYRMERHLASKKKIRAGALRGVIENIWQRFPLGIANALGPVLRRYIDR